MHWFLVLLIFNGPGGDVGIYPGYVAPPPARIELAMASQAECEKIRDENKFSNLQCWAKPDEIVTGLSITGAKVPVNGSATIAFPPTFPQH